MGDSGKGLLPHESLPVVRFRQGPDRPVYLLLEEHGIVAFIAARQFRFGLAGDVGGSQEALAGALGPVIDRADFGAHPGFVNQFHGGQEIVQEGAEGLIDLGEGLVFGGGVETGVAGIIAGAYDTSYRLEFFCSMKRLSLFL
jgi:hypothetical protein